MRLYKILITVLILQMAAFHLQAQNTNTGKPLSDLKKAEIMVPRLALQPVKSMSHHEGDPIDTLATELSYVKVVLYSDNTWKYIKDADHLAKKDVFNEYWDNKNSNPYKIPLDSLDSSWAIWLVDDMSEYHCPFQGSVYYRGKFGPRRGRRHLGVDLPLKVGEPIYATFNGKVRMSTYMQGYGNVVVIRHENGLETFHGHLSKRLVEEGAYVNAGDVIGHGGNTGRSTGPHLHFETRYKGYAFDPEWIINFKDGNLRRRLFVLKKKYFDIHSSYEQDFESEWMNNEEDKKEDAEKAAMKYYTIKSGDTLGKIAARNGTTVNALCKLNGISTKTVLKIGRRIRVR